MRLSGTGTLPRGIATVRNTFPGRPIQARPLVPLPRSCSLAATAKTPLSPLPCGICRAERGGGGEGKGAVMLHIEIPPSRRSKRPYRIQSKAGALYVPAGNVGTVPCKKRLPLVTGRFQAAGTCHAPCCKLRYRLWQKQRAFFNAIILLRGRRI